MEYYTKPFNYNNTLGLPYVTKEYGVREVSVGWNNESAKNIPIVFYPIGTILSQNYDCVVSIGLQELYDPY